MSLSVSSQPVWVCKVFNTLDVGTYYALSYASKLMIIANYVVSCLQNNLGGFMLNSIYQCVSVEIILIKNVVANIIQGKYGMAVECKITSLFVGVVV